MIDWTTLCPESAAGGFTAQDGTIEFYTRVQALADENVLTVLDYGAGRAEWFEDDPVTYRRRLRDLRVQGRKVIGADVDAAVFTNRATDQQIQFEAGQPLPLADGSIDLIVSDFVLEHVDDPKSFVAEVHRLLRPGGWFCARTPNRWALQALATQVVANRLHEQILSRAQPGRKAEDIFPTRFRLNTVRAVRRWFQSDAWVNATYRHTPEPAYHFNSAFILRAFQLLNWLLPPQMGTMLHVFVQKRDKESY